MLDLARLGALALERGTAGVVPELGFFFKDPAGTDEHALERQYAVLTEWAAQAVTAREGARAGRRRGARPPSCRPLRPRRRAARRCRLGQGRDVPRAAGLAAASSCLYLAGMALNDYADREVDAVSARAGRSRPVASSPRSRSARGRAHGGGAGLGGRRGGGRALRGPRAVAASVWAYDLVAKQTPAGPAVMAARRGLDVLMGACALRRSSGAAAAAAVAAHTLTTTTVSRREVEGATPRLPRLAAAATVVVAAAAGAVAASSSRSAARLAAAAGLVGAYAATVGGAHARAIQDPSPTRLQQAVGRPCSA